MSTEFEKILIEKLDKLEAKIDSLEHKVDSSINGNLARILEQQTKDHKEIINISKKQQEILKELKSYEKRNEKDHKRFSYEINSLKTYVLNGIAQ